MSQEHPTATVKNPCPHNLPPDECCGYCPRLPFASKPDKPQSPSGLMPSSNRYRKYLYE